MFFEAATVVFRSLDAVTDMITEPEMDILEQFKVIMYDQSNTTCKVDEAQLDLFALKRPSMNMWKELLTKQVMFGVRQLRQCNNYHLRQTGDG